MSDIIDIIDGLHAEATKGPLRRSEASGVIESSDGVFVASGTWPHDGNMLVALVNNWPSISARLREAERERDEWKWASEKNGDAMSGYQSRAIVAEQRLVEAERKEADSDTLRNRMDAILTETANALKGEPQPDTAHSWHDLPLLAGIAVANEKALMERIAELERKSAAWDAFVDGMDYRCEEGGWVVRLRTQKSTHKRADLLTAIEAAIAAKETEQ